MTLKELETQLIALTPQEKAEVIQMLVANLIHTGAAIQKTPDIMGGDACIGQTRIPVWLLVSYRRQGMSDAELLENYSISAADLVNAWAYAEANPEEIEAARRKHNEA
jgi:uncharacterized protein (DUF433 family)